MTIKEMEKRSAETLGKEQAYLDGLKKQLDTARRDFEVSGLYQALATSTARIEGMKRIMRALGIAEIKH